MSKGKKYNTPKRFWNKMPHKKSWKAHVMSSDHKKFKWFFRKKKWFTDVGRQKRVEQAFDSAKNELLQSFGFENKYCKDCKHWKAEPKSESGYGKCKLHTSCLMHRCETCEKWEEKNNG